MTEQMSRHDMSEHKQKDAIKNVEANLPKRGKHEANDVILYTYNVYTPKQFYKT
jgi:hypothetical protein